MKITLNLSPPLSARDRYALAWAIPAMVVGLVALVLLVRASLREFRDYRAMQRQLTELQYHADELRDQEAAIRRKLADPAYRELLNRAKFVNDLINQRVFSPTEVSARLAGLLPEDAHLTALALSTPKKPGEDYTVRMGITAKGEEAIETFMNDLEDSADFKDVSILTQGIQEEASQGSQVNIVCTARYLPGAEEAFEEKSQEAEAASKKSEAGNQAPRAKSQKPGSKTQETKTGNQKVEKPRAEKPTSNRTSNP